jgi:site-specific DNA-methyltransferase (adenine-specific)
LQSGKLEPHHSDRGKAAGTLGAFAGAPGRESIGDSGGASRFFYCAKTSRGERNAGLEGFEKKPVGFKNSSGRGLSSREGDQYAERPAANVHPTVKPINLMRWLVRLVTPPGGLCFDPFLGSGSTGCAAILEGFDFIGIEREAEYIAIAEARIAFWAEHVGREVDEVLGLHTVSQREAKLHADRGQEALDLGAAA